MKSAEAAAIKAVLFDLGGVVFDSPLHTIASFEEDQGLPTGIVGRIVMGAGSNGAWARHERGEIDYQEFQRSLYEEAREWGVELDVGEMMERIDSEMGVRPKMLDAVNRLRNRGFAVAAITNNWEEIEAPSLTDHFDTVVESYVEGVRKPEPEIYRRTLARLGVAPSEAVMLDDIGANLKTARSMGMATIKVTDPEAALQELGELVGLSLL
jgi:putative hydrolase of the HAD superfamily